MTMESRKTPALRLRLLGDLAVYRHGLPLALPPSKKTRALLGYLAATAKPHLREHLCGLLWDGPDDPRAQLRWSLTKLRPLVDDGTIQRLRAERDRIALDADGVEIDLQTVRAVARRGLSEISTDELAGLAERFAGTFLEGLELSSCYRFHAWCIALREEMHALQVAVVNALVERLRTSSPEQALRHALTLVALDPLAESSHVTVVRLLDELGRAREALAGYERWRRLLAHELGGTPSREMEGLRMAIGKNPAGSADAAAPAPVHAIIARSALSIPLIGRASEIAILARMLDAAGVGRGREIALLVGDPGIGKSRLLEELADRTRAAGGQVLAGRAFECELVRPYGAWVDALRSSGGVFAPSVGEFSPGWRAASTWPDPPGAGGAAGTRETDRNHMFEAVTRSLIASARERSPLLVLLDDIQWLDEASAALLHFVCRALEGQPILIACAARSGELSDNPGVLRVVRTLVRDHRLQQLVLSPLDETAVAELVAAVSDETEARAVRAVIEGSEGNPLFAIEMARAGLAGRESVTQTLGALIGERLERLDEKAQALLPFAAALGRSFDPRILARVLDRPAVEFFSALGELERRGVLRAAGPDAYDFSHDLVRQAAYQRLSEPRRRLIHLQLARVLASWEDPDGELKNDLAHHAALGGDSETAARAYLAAADRSMRLFAWGEAGELARRGIQKLPGLNRSTRLHLHVELLGVEVLGKSTPQRAPELELELSSLLAAAEEAGLHAVVARGHYLRAVLQFRGENAAGAIETSWRMVVAGRAGDALTAARSQAEAGRCLVLIERDVVKAKGLLEEAHAVLPDQQDDLILNWGLGLLKRYTGEAEEAARLLSQAALLARRIESHWEETECLRALTVLAIEQGDFAAARAHCPPMLELATKMGEGSERPIAEALDSLARVLAGDDAAEAALEPALGRVRDADAKVMLSTLLNFAAENDLLQGRPGRARQRASQALIAALAVERTSQVIIARAILARLALRAGDRAGAGQLLHPAAAELGVPFAVSSHARRLAEQALAELDAAAARGEDG
jgi:predicted ATPase/DNA-binding SARP family transcriptional activator